MSEQPLLLDAPSPRPKTPCDKLKELHGIVTEWSHLPPAWWAFIPNEEGAAYFAPEESEAVFGLCGQLHLDTSIILKP